MIIFYFIIGALISFAIPNNLITEISIQNLNFLSKHLLLAISGNFYILTYKIIVAILIIINAILLNTLVLQTKISLPNNMFYGFVFLALIGPAIIFCNSISILIASALLIISLLIILKTANKSIAIFDFFNVGFLFSFAFLFWETSIYFTPIVFISMLILRILNWRELLVAIIGFFTPIFFISSIYFFIYSNFDLLFSYYHSIQNEDILPNYSLIQILFFSFISSISLLSILKTLAKYNVLETYKQDFYKVFFFFFLNYIGISFIFYSSITSIFIIGAIPLSILISVFLQSLNNKIVAEIIFFIFLTVSVLAVLNI